METKRTKIILNMKNYLKLGTSCILATFAFSLAGCSDKEDEPKSNYVYYQSDLWKEFSLNHILVPENSYGPRLYNGTDWQITEGPRLNLYDNKVYAQFPVNYGETYNNYNQQVWAYSFYLGGMALSKYFDMEDDSYYNQLSVYDTTSPSGGIFMVSNGSSEITDPSNATLSDYAKCGHIYITDLNGYAITEYGKPNSYTYGVERKAFLESVWINNTTYTYLTMKNGNEFASALNKENQGWFKVQFITFDHNDPNSKPTGWKEFYLANFDENNADGWTGIVDKWVNIDLSSLPECSIIIVNFVGSDMGLYGLNTPAYCAMDNFIFKIDTKQWLGVD